MNAPVPPSSNGAPKPAPAFKPVVSRGARREPPRLVIHGDGGLGKSTVASGAPDPIFLDLERGTLELDVARVENITTWEGLRATVRGYAQDQEGFKTVVIDTLDRAEWLCWQHVCREARVDSIEKVGKGFGKGYVAAYEQFRALARDLDACRAAGMGIIVIAHSKIEKAPNAAGDEYERWTLKVDRRVAGLFYESFDAVLYARLETFTQKSESGKTKGFGERRVMETQASPAWLAKNRYRLPAQLPLAWEELSAGINRGAAELVTALSEEIDAAIKRLDALDADAAAKARGTLKSTPETAAALSVLLNRINAGVATREAARASASDSTHDTDNTPDAT
jgi:hypothetical protein